jgi:protein gp37
MRAKLHQEVPQPAPAVAAENPPQPAPTTDKPAKAKPISLEAFTKSLDATKRKRLDELKEQLAKCEKDSTVASRSATKTFAEKAEACLELRKLLGDHYRAYMHKQFSYRKSHAARWAQAGEVLKVASPRGDDVFLTSEAHVRPLTGLQEADLNAVLDRLGQWRKWAPNSQLTPAWCEAAVQFQKTDHQPNTDPSDKAKVVAEVFEHFKKVQAALPAEPTEKLTKSVENFTAEVSILGQQSSTGIAWTQATWNPLHGCQWASKGCDHCYAAKLMATRMRDRYPGLAEVREKDGKKGYFFTNKILLDPKDLAEVLVDKSPKRYFVNSMSDLFHGDVPYDYINAVFNVMETAWWHQYQVLTKRPKRMAEYSRQRYADQQPPPHIWLGTTAENQAAFDKRIEHLAATRTAVRWLSCEPLIGPIELGKKKQFDWIVIGGETGSRRKMEKEWAASLRDQCAELNVPLFFKQWGDFNEAGEYEKMKNDDSAKLPLIDGVKHGNYPMRVDLAVLKRASEAKDQQAIHKLLRGCLQTSPAKPQPTGRKGRC